MSEPEKSETPIRTVGDLPSEMAMRLADQQMSKNKHEKRSKKTSVTQIQMARECIAATVNQDETLTVKEAREHASQALDHIEQAEEAFDAMREAMIKVFTRGEIALRNLKAGHRALAIGQLEELIEIADAALRPWRGTT